MKKKNLQMPILLITRKRNLQEVKGPRRKVDLSKIECYNCHKMGHYKSDCPENPRIRRENRDQANVVDEGSPKKNKTEESEVKGLILRTLSPSTLSFF
jgi:hypothetical protein